MASSELDPYDLLQRNGLNLAPHVRALLKDQGYYDLRTLALIGSHEPLQASIIESADEYSGLEEEKRKELLGPKWFKDPSKFKFLPGEIAAISTIKPLCEELLLKMPLVIPSPNLMPQNATTPSNQKSLSSKKNSDPNKGEALVDKMGKSIDVYVADWCEKREDQLDFGSDDFCVKSNTLFCSKCHLSIKFTLSADGYWRAHTFLSHISSKHSKPKAGGNSKQGSAVSGTKKPGDKSASNTKANNKLKNMFEQRKSLSSVNSFQEDENPKGVDDLDSSVGSEIESITEEQIEQSSQEEEDADPPESEAESSQRQKQPKSKSKVTSSGVKIKKSNTTIQKSSSLIPKLSSTMKANQAASIAKKSRSDKRRAALLRSGATDLYQTCITSYFKILDDIEALSQKNRELRGQLKEMLLKYKQQRDVSTQFLPTEEFNESEKTDHISLLRRMMNQALTQSRKKKKGRRYTDPVLIDFALNIWILGGRHTYEILHDNMPGVLPSPTAIHRKLEKYNVSCVPGTIYLGTLLDSITKNNYPMKVLISEDATAIIARREFHLRYNSILGGSLPLTGTGLPDPERCVVNSAVDIANFYKLYPAASVVFVIMAQPMSDFAAPVRIGSFASDNKMTSLDVKRRHAYIDECLRNAGIERVATGSDGDSRELRYMLDHMGIGMTLSELPFRKDSDEYRFFQQCPGFACNVLSTDFVAQDVPHIATKLKTKLLKPEIIALGDYVATPNDLQCLLEQRSKEKTLIRQGDFILADKMNFDAAVRLSRPGVRQLLSEVWKGDAAGTSFYLEMIDLVTSSFLDKNLLPLERVDRMWTALYSLRYWRRWLTSDKVYTLAKNFISSNAYLSIEINAHTLLLIIRKCRREETPELLLSWLLGSQQCESFFRAIRAMCPVGLNKPNFTEGEFMDRARKADASLLIQQQGMRDGVMYRREEKKKNRSGGTQEALQVVTLPSDEELSKQLKACQLKAKKKINDLGIILDGGDKNNFAFDRSYGRKLKQNKITETELQDEDEEDQLEEFAFNGEEEEDEHDNHDLQVLRSLHQANFMDFSGKNLPSDGDDPNEDLSKSGFVKLPDSDGNIRLVKKSTLCWFLENGIRKMSNDRVLRVRQLASFADTRRLIVKSVEDRPIVRIGDWCLFKTLSDQKKSFRFLLGRVIQFSALKTTSSQKKNRSIYEWEKGTPDIGVNCTWYKFDGQNVSSRTISSSGTKLAVFSHGFHPCETYICSLPPPEIPCWKTIAYSSDVVAAVKPLL